MKFRDRTDAGRQLGRLLASISFRADPLVLAIPRGGVLVGFEVAELLRAPLDIWLARKIGAPSNPELAIGSVSLTGDAILDPQSIQILGVTQAYIDSEILRQREEILRAAARYRGKRQPPPVHGKTVVLVDDGIATGATVLAAARSLRALDPAELILAVPVAPAAACERLASEVDELTVLLSPPDLGSVGEFYEDFSQVTDEEVIDRMYR